MESLLANSNNNSHGIVNN